MGKNEIVPFIPPTEEEIMLIQPNNVTFGQYNFTDWQENLLTLISDKIQGHMTRKDSLQLDLFNQPYVQVNCDEAGGRNNKAKVLKEAKEMLTKRFSFRWKHPSNGSDVDTTGTIVTTVHNVQGTNKIILNINPWAIPFLVYYGTSVGGTRFSKGIALGLRGNYTKRIYKIICSQRDRAEYYYPISQFRKDLEIPDRKTNSEIERDILRPSQKRIKESDSDVWFDYKLICRKPLPDRKPKADTIVFVIHSDKPIEEGGEQGDLYIFSYNWISDAMRHPTDDRVQRALEMIIEKGRLKEVYDRCVYYHEQVSTRQKERAHAHNSLLKMLREEFGIDVRKKKK